MLRLVAFLVIIQWTPCFIEDRNNGKSKKVMMMLEFTIPGFAILKLEHALIDFNGTLAIDGLLIKGIASQLTELAKHLQLHVITGDSFGTAQNELAGLPCQLTILPSENQAIAKANYLRQLNPKQTVAIGNGRNDQQMLREATVGIAVLGDEGAASEAMTAADIVTPDIFGALNLLLHPSRLIATLRS